MRSKQAPLRRVVGPPAEGGPLGLELIWPGKHDRAHVPATEGPLTTLERVPGPSRQEASPNLLVRGDNLGAMSALMPRYGGTIDLIYIDPPFATGADFHFTGLPAQPSRPSALAYRDRWDTGLPAYLSAMAARLRLMRDLLSERGTIFVHCDWRTSHWLRCLLDEIYGAACFKNEIVWRYRRWPAKTRVFQRMHDVLLWYGKTSADRHAFHVLYEDLAASTRETWGTKKQVADFSSGRRKPSQLEIETPGAPMSDVWDVGIIAPIAHERLGYPTQKPEMLLRRVIEAASEPGDLIADFFCGSGTTLAVADKLGRRWIGCDVGRIAIHTARKRLLSVGLAPFELVGSGPDDEAEAPAPLVDVEPSAAGVRGARTRAVKLTLRAQSRGALESVDAWAVDWNHDGAVFSTAWHASRTRLVPDLPVETPAHACGPGPRRIAVKIADVLGNERVVRLRWDAR